MSSGLVRAKVVLVGAPAVGKSSLVRRFVHSIFSEDYHSTLGVKVDRKSLVVDDRDVNLIIWDMHGETTGLDVPAKYLRGAAGGLVVFDADRPETMEKAAELQDRVLTESPSAVLRLVANKADLDIDWSQVDERCVELNLPSPNRTSALSGDGVEAVFESIGRALVGDGLRPGGARSRTPNRS